MSAPATFPKCFKKTADELYEIHLAAPVRSWVGKTPSIHNRAFFYMRLGTAMLAESIVDALFLVAGTIYDLVAGLLKCAYTEARGRPAREHFYSILIDIPKIILFTIPVCAIGGACFTLFGIPYAPYHYYKTLRGI